MIIPLAHVGVNVLLFWEHQYCSIHEWGAGEYGFTGDMGIPVEEKSYKFRGWTFYPSIYQLIHVFPSFVHLLHYLFLTLALQCRGCKNLFNLSSTPTSLPHSPSCSLSPHTSLTPVLLPCSAPHQYVPAFNTIHLLLLPIPFTLCFHFSPLFLFLSTASFAFMRLILPIRILLSLLALLCIHLLPTPASLPPTTQIPPQMSTKPPTKIKLRGHLWGRSVCLMYVSVRVCSCM